VGLGVATAEGACVPPSGMVCDVVAWMDRGCASLPLQPPIATVAVRAAVKTAYRMVLMTFPLSSG
jgi:hypothetical protein